ncbi:Zn(2+)-responsive transcriptional regulator [Colwellia sp. UCD-KL20]|uniref:Zn(2+)-responsive transcriptional regulator n=1 Tax=Colwellia sp. UCD-KL20 TaxID=1917165 RepID=UPI000970A257|nr:Zn(2+)-responsive transcriptional regulator [Colwellia sp. UCD-KL20]
MYQIGELAKKLSVTTDTLRYYEKHGLLSPCSRSDTGYRLYNDGNLRSLQFIISAKKCGFTLNDIQELLSIQVDKNSHSCHEVKSFTEHKLQQVEDKISELVAIQSSLKKLVEACCGGNESAAHCSILSTLEDDDGITH